MFSKKGKKFFNLATSLFFMCFLSLNLIFTLSCSAGKYNINEWPTSNGKIHPKKFIMKQKIWTLGDKFLIKDENKKPLFYVKGKVFSFGDKLSFRDINGKELAYISQKTFSFRPFYRIYRDGKLMAKIVKKLLLFKDKYIVDVSGAEDYIVTGNFGNYEYTITRGGKKVAYVSKKFFSWSDTYGISIAPEEDEILILSIAVVLDLVSHGDECHYTQFD